MKPYNFAPGPTPIPHDINIKMADQPLNHRSAEYSRVLMEASENLKYLFQTTNDVLIFTASGTGAMEAAVANTLSPDDRAVVIRSGKFGGRWVEICEAYGIEVILVDVDWGQAVNPDDVSEALRRESGVKAVLATHSETSTGVLHDIEALGAVVRDHDALFIVDAISGLGANDLRTDDWGVDIVISGSQKGMMIPPGLSFAGVSQRAWQAVRQCKSPSYYLSFERARTSLEKGVNPYTPAVTLMVGLAEALRKIKSIGLEAVFARHALWAGATRAGVRALGLELFAKRPSNVLTSVVMPSGIDGSALLKYLKTTHDVSIANGMEQYKGKTIRISHLGYDIDAFHVLTGISALEFGLNQFGYGFEAGEGVAAAQRVLMGR